MKPLQERYDEVIANLHRVDGINKRLRFRINQVLGMGPVISPNDSRFVAGYNYACNEMRRLLGEGGLMNEENEASDWIRARLVGALNSTDLASECSHDDEVVWMELTERYRSTCKKCARVEFRDKTEVD